MPLILQVSQIETMTAQAVECYPEECCGLLLGTLTPASDLRHVYEVQPLSNDWTPAVNPFAAADGGESLVSKGNRFWIDPQALLTAQRYGRDRGWIILGVYHSHPDHPAVPSERDRQLAWSGYSYPILAVVAGQVTALTSWQLGADGQFVQEAVVRVPCAALAPGLNGKNYQP